MELPKFHKENVIELNTDLESWLYVFKYTTKLKEEEMKILVDKTPDLSKAFTILEQYSNDPKKRAEIEERLKSDRDYAYDLAARFEAGERQGIEKGIEKGKLKGKLEDARRMLSKGIDLNTILEITDLTEQDLQDSDILSEK